MKKLLRLALLGLLTLPGFAQESLPPLHDGKVPQNLDELWAGYDPRKEPLEIEVIKEWEQDGIVCRVIRYQVGIFKGVPAKVAAFYTFPKGAKKLPGLVQIHGGGQSANLAVAVTDAKRGYACISLNWGGNKMSLGSKETYEGPNTDWGNLDATHPPQRNKVNHFASGIEPDEFTLDPVVSPRNGNWFLVVLAARRALTFLEQQPEVDPDRLGVYGHSMGGRLTTQLTGIDQRVKAAVPSCGGSGDLLESQTEVAGGRRTNPSALELATVSENEYIKRISVPTLWLSPTNDFHAHIDNMAFTWRNVPDSLLRLSISPHFNHRHTNENLLTQHLWFEQHLKGVFTMPQTPKLVVNLKTANGVPMATVTPDGSLPVKSVEIYYSNDPHGLTRFWRDAQAHAQGKQWEGAMPLTSLDQPLFAFANVLYETPSQYRNLPMAPGQANSDHFVISSREFSILPEKLKAAELKAAEKSEPMIDDGSRGWHDWYRLNWGNPILWTAVTRKLKDPKWRGPDGARLVFEVNAKADCTLVVKVTCNEWNAFSNGPKLEYAVAKNVSPADEWREVSVALRDLVSTDLKIKEPLANWQTVTELSLSPSGDVVIEGEKINFVGRRWEDARATQFRNLHWEGGK